MNDRILKAAMKASLNAALDAMSEQELMELSNDHYILRSEDWPNAVLSGSYTMFDMGHLIEYQIKCFKEGQHVKGWSVILTEVLDALWAIHDDHSEKTKVFLEWIAKQQ